MSISGSGCDPKPNFRASFCPAAESSSESSPTADDLTANLLKDLQSIPSNSLSNSEIMADSSIEDVASDAISVVALVKIEVEDLIELVALLYRVTKQLVPNLQLTLM